MNQQSLLVIQIIIGVGSIGLLAPLFLIPLVKFTGYSEFFEEITKLLVILFLVLRLQSYKIQTFITVFFAFLFGLSENIFYLNNIFQLGDFSIFWQRFLWTVPMHIITALLILFFVLAGKRLGQQQKFFASTFIIFGLIGAIVLHLLFNSMVAGVLIK